MKDKKNIVIALLTILVLAKIPQVELRFIFWILSGIVLCSGLDILINRICLKKSIFPKSAIITGFIVSGILDYHQPFYILAIIAILAILSKHIIRYKNTHIFNLANFALFAASVFKLPITWSIESNIYIIILVGLYLAYSIKKMLHIYKFVPVIDIFTGSLFVANLSNPVLRKIRG